MMNRIILIGNGFDLAHGLKTSYADFIEDYWENWVKLFTKSNKNSITDRLATLTIRDKRHYWTDIAFGITYNKTAAETLEFIKGNKDAYEIKYTPFFEMINKTVETKGWVDIENEFYLWLKKIFKRDDCGYDNPVPLNEELELIKGKLIEYLKLIEEEQIRPELVKDCIRNVIYEPFKAQDISNEGKTNFENFLRDRLEYLIGNDEQRVSSFLQRFGYSYIDRSSDIETYGQSVTMSQESPVTHDKLDRWKHLQYVNDGKNIVPDCFLWPDQILLLNFNYTNTADLYIPKGSEFKVNHIHGQLGNDKNPIIFGYGDELDDDYKEISKLNDNDYLKNIKSIRYLEMDNYRKLLSFINSAPFQIYIMGHSCGNSDRTLLNTLFEHKNCVSIKPFYYEKPDGTDNYIEIVQNISRNFNDMRLMRDRVVNKTYCRPLVPRE
ncbi:AbiH family protein [uncultured Alistipes sp.]|uniref:AbiH family protein n=1 Tax=uncultured Alistipes sp. TaxID=538949 RepID=UPI00272D2CA6|nr:AbiH family protein [uncultured Alistipes sp.]